MTTNLPSLAITQQLMQQTLTGKAITLPFARDIFLLETHIAGMNYHQAAQLASPCEAGQILILRREPSNPYDDLAIAVLTLADEKLGYVPRHRNPVLARLMDAGKRLRVSVAKTGEWQGVPEIRINISLQDD